MTQQVPPYASPEQPSGQGPGPYQGQPPGPYPGAPAPGTNLMAILSIVFAFVFSPLGIVFGIVGRKQIARTGENGRGLATAGLILSTIFLVIGIATAVIVGVMAASIASNLPTGVAPEAVAAQIEQQTSGRATDVTCPAELPAQVGASITCSGTVDGAPAQIQATATAVEGTTVSFDIQQVG